MGKRLSKIYTRTGDDGTTGLGDGTRVPKDHLRIIAIGAVDELNSAIGLVLAHDVMKPVAECLLAAQHDLFELGGELSLPEMVLLPPARVQFLEQQLDLFNADLPALEEFILPGGGLASATCHVARSICRRAECEVISAASVHAVRADIVIYLNRLSDLLFVLARVLARRHSSGEVQWQRER